MKNQLFGLLLSIYSIGAFANGNWQTQSLSGNKTAAYYSSLSAGEYGKNQYLMAAYLDKATYIVGKPWGIPTFSQYIGGQFYPVSINTTTKEATALVPYIDERGIYYFAYFNSNGQLQYGKITPGLVQGSINTQKVGEVSLDKNSLKDTDAIFPNWYGMTAFSYAVYNNDVYMNYNIDNNGIIQITSKKCHGGICFTLPSLLNKDDDFAYFSSTSIHNGEVYVSFNERVGGNNGPIYGVVKKYNSTSKVWEGVCGGNLSTPGTVSKVVSRVEFDKRGNPVVLDNAIGTDGEINLNVMECRNNVWTRVGNTFVANVGVWYPQLIINRNSKNDINVIYRTDTSGDGHGKIYAKSYSYSSGRWIGLGGHNDNGLVSDPNVLNADQQVASVQNGKLYVEFKQSESVEPIGVMRPVVKTFEVKNNKWNNVCNLPVKTNSNNSNVWFAAGAGGFINNYNGQNFVIFNQNFENNPNQPDAETLPGKYSVDVASCGAN